MEDGAINTRSGEPLSDSGCWPAVDTTLHPADLELGSLEHLADVVDRTRGNPHLLAQCHLRLSFPFREDGSQHLAEFNSDLFLRIIRGIALGSCPFEMPDDFAERLPPAAIAGGESEVAIVGLDLLTGRTFEMDVSRGTGMRSTGPGTLVNPPLARAMNLQPVRPLLGPSEP